MSSSNTREANLYLECFERWDSLVTEEEKLSSGPNELVNQGEKVSIKALNGFSSSAAAKVFEEEIREVVCLLTFIVCPFLRIHFIFIP